MGESVSTESQPRQKPLVVGSYFPTLCKSSKKPVEIFSMQFQADQSLRCFPLFHRALPEKEKTDVLAFCYGSKVMFRSTLTVRNGRLAISQVEHDHGVGRLAPASAPQKRAHAAERQASNRSEHQQYPNQNKGVNHQVADVVAACGDAFVERDVGLVADKRQ